MKKLRMQVVCKDSVRPGEHKCRTAAVRVLAMVAITLLLAASSLAASTEPGLKYTELNDCASQQQARDQDNKRAAVT